MTRIDIAASKTIVGAAGPAAPIIYVIDSPEHPFDEAPLVAKRNATIVTLPVDSWNDALTPWPASGIYRGEPDFGGHATETLAELRGEAIPAIEAQAGLSPTVRAICGYSLGGLFALYALTQADGFAACGCLSGSVWYEGWAEHLRELPLDLAGRYAYLSLGTKERRAARPLLKAVQDRMEQCADILRTRGCTVDYRLTPGNHFQHITQRLDAGLGALDTFLSQKEAADHGLIN